MSYMRSHIFCFLISILVIQFASAQEREVYNRDSVFKVLESEQSPVKRAEAFIYLGDSYFLTQTDSSIFFFDKANEHLKHSTEYELLCGISTQLGQLYQYMDPTKAAKYAIESVEYSEKSENPEAIVRAHVLLGNIHRSNGELDKAMEEYQFCLSIEEEENDSIGIARLYNNIGIVHMMDSKYDIGIEYWLQSLEIKLALNNLTSAASTMANIGLYYKDIERYDEANEYLEQALAINLKLRDFESIAFNYTIIGRMYQRKGENYKAIDNLNLALVYCDSNQVRFNKEEAYLGLAESYANIGDYKMAYSMASELIILRRDLYDERNSETTRELTAKFESEQKEKELEMLKSVNDAQEAKIKEEEANIALKEENNQYLLIALVFAGLGIIAIVFVLFRVRSAKKQIELQKHIVEEKNKEITDSISYAKRLQEAILPVKSTIDSVLPNNFVLYLPKDIVAGDFYWMEVQEETVLLAAADCTGHGVPGALVSVVCHNALNRAVREFGLKDPGKILDKVTDLVIETFEKSEKEVKDGMDIALCSINLNSRQVTYAGANNSLYYLKNGGEEIQEIKANKQPVGKYLNRSPFETKSLQLEKDDIFYLFTDGYADQFGGEKGKKMKYKPFKQKLVDTSNLSAENQNIELKKAFLDWKGDHEQVDDVCVIGVRL